MTGPIRDAAARLLLGQALSSFYALGVMDLRKFKGAFLIDSYASFERRSGERLPVPPHLRPCGMTVCAPLLHGRALILYDERLPRTRLAFTLAHEMGHLALGHGQDGDKADGGGAGGGCGGGGEGDADRTLERASDAFAACLLMPPSVILAWEEWTGRRMEAEELVRCFPVSPLTARRQRLAMDRMKQRGMTLSGAERSLVGGLFAPLLTGGPPCRRGERFNYDSTAGMDNQTARCLTRGIYL